MDISKDITIILTPEEAKKIILDYLNATHPDFEMIDAHFDVEVRHRDFMDEAGYHVIGSIDCKGKIK